MSAKSHHFGYAIVFDGEKWIYADDKTEIVNSDRACKLCNRKKTLEGYDPCLGFLPNVVSACCGHGVSAPILMLQCEI